MYRYHCMNPIADKGLERFNTNYEASEDLHADVILVRSAELKSEEIPDEVLAIVRAGAGVNNIPLQDCAERGIVVFNTPGANANGVKELAIAGMLLASRDIVGGIEWIEKQKDREDISRRAEKEKKQFVGTEIAGKKLGIIGLGAIGVLVANAAVALGMDVYGYDPYISVNAAWNVSRSIHHSRDINEIFHDCDYITLHVPVTDETKKMISANAISQMKDGAVLLNFAREELVDEEALITALETGKLRKYVTDFATPAIAQAENTLVTPHLGASTEESEENSAVMAVKEARAFLEHGNIRHSVNYPDCELGKCQSAARVTICHRNIPNMLGQFTTLIGMLGINIADIASKSRGKYAYVIIDIGSRATKEMVEQLEKMEGVLRVRVIQ